MVRLIFSAILVSMAAAQAETPATAPAPPPADDHVSLQVQGCADRCPSFEIIVNDGGRITFRPNNQYNSANGPRYKYGMGAVYKRVAGYLQDSGAFNPPADCTEPREGAAVVKVQAVKDGQTQQATWSAGCANQAEKAKSIAKVFVNQTGMWNKINSDSRYWEKHWETWEYPAKE